MIKECTGNEFARIKYKRKAKTVDQRERLFKELTSNIILTRDKIKQIAREYELSYIQVYKWYWDQRKVNNTIIA